MGMNDKAVKDLNPEFIKIIDSLPNDRKGLAKGHADTVTQEIRPTFLQGDSDTVLGDQQKSNATIVLGTDRPKCRWSGYGGRGYTQCAAIDIVVGRMAYKPKDVFVDPSFKLDAARIYLSQKTDIDDNCYLTEGTVGNAKGRSAIALMADGIRLVSREGIKIMSAVHSKNSQGGDMESIVGIDIIAGNRTEGLQPLPKGRNLTEAMGRLASHVNDLNGIVDHLLTTQMNFNESLTHHFHYSPFYGNPTTPSDAVVGKGIKTSIDFLQDTKRSLLTNKTNLVNFKQTYLEPSGCKYINSRWNNVN
jgi:hypothetical protein